MISEPGEYEGKMILGCCGQEVSYFNDNAREGAFLPCPSCYEIHLLYLDLDKLRTEVKKIGRWYRGYTAFMSRENWGKLIEFGERTESYLLLQDVYTTFDGKSIFNDEVFVLIDEFLPQPLTDFMDTSEAVEYNSQRNNFEITLGKFSRTMFPGYESNLPNDVLVVLLDAERNVPYRKPKKGKVLWSLHKDQQLVKAVNNILETDSEHVLDLLYMSELPRMLEIADEYGAGMQLRDKILFGLLSHIATRS